MGYLIEKVSKFVDGFRPCTKTAVAIEQNVKATTALTESIVSLTDTLSATKVITRRSTDDETDQSWRRRRSGLK